MNLRRTNKIQEFSVDWDVELKNNEEFEVISIKDKKILIKMTDYKLRSVIKISHVLT